MRTAMACVSLAIIAVNSVSVAGATASANAAPTFRGKIAYEVYSNQTAWIEVLELASRKVTRLTRPVPAAAGYFGPYEELTWSPNGTRLAFTTEARTNSNNVYVVDVATRQRRKLTVSLPGTYNGQLAWSPDGRSIAFSRHSSLDSSVSGVYIAKLGVFEGRRLHHAAEGPISWSPNGSRVAFVDSRFDDDGCTKDVRLFIKTTSGDRTTEIRAQPAYAKQTYNVDILSWRPRRGTLLYVTNDTDYRESEGACVSYMLDDGTAVFALSPPQTRSTRLLRRSDAMIDGALWSPTGGAIAYTIRTAGQLDPERSLRVMTPAGQGQRTLASDFWGDFAWKRDGRQLIEASATNVLLRNVTNGRASGLALWEEVGESSGHIFAVGKQAVAVDAGASEDAEGNTLEQRVALARLSGGGFEVITLRVGKGWIGDVAVTLP